MRNEIEMQCQAKDVMGKMHCGPCSLTWEKNESVPAKCRAYEQLALPGVEGKSTSLLIPPRSPQKDKYKDPSVVEIPIFRDHQKNIENHVGCIRVSPGGMVTIEFKKPFEPTHAKMQELFGCAAGQILQQTDDGRIKLFRVMSWGYK